ncbi:AT-rich interactive domain-containing protein 5A [Polypterus senegalus]|nr:AT-rich interactive domain-containing protein 5A [Polypterus senegalus]
MASIQSCRSRRKPSQTDSSEGDSAAENDETLLQANSEAEFSDQAEGTVVKEVAGQSEMKDQEEKTFMANLYTFMKERSTPIERIPHLGFKQINLWSIYKAVEKMGGYDSVTARRLWKNVYDELGGSPGSTSAATCTRRHYEKLVLPYERWLRGEEDKPLPPTKPRKYQTTPKEVKGMKTEVKKKKDQQEKNYKASDGDKMQEIKEDHPRCEYRICLHSSHGSAQLKTQDSLGPNGSHNQKEMEDATNVRLHDECESSLKNKHAGICPLPAGSQNCQSGISYPSSQPIKSLVSSFQSKCSHGAGISPLVKKKLAAQASSASSFNSLQEEAVEKGVDSQRLCSSPEDDTGRPSVIHHTQLPEHPGPTDSSRTSEDGSPIPASSPSLSLCSSSEDSFSQPEDNKITPERSRPSAYIGSFTSVPFANGVYKPLSHYPSKEHPSYLQLPKTYLDDTSYKTAGSRTCAQSDSGSLISREQATDMSLPRSAWSRGGKEQHRIPSPKCNHQAASSSTCSPKACWVPPMPLSSFTKVKPKAGEATAYSFLSGGAIAHQGFKLHEMQKRALEDPDPAATFTKKFKVVPPLPKNSVNMKDKLEPGIVKPFATHKLVQPQASLALPALLPCYDHARPMASTYSLEQLKNFSLLSPPPNPYVYPSLPAHVALPASASQLPESVYHYIGATPFIPQYEASRRSRLYSIPLCFSQAGYALPSLHQMYPNTKLS